MSGSLTNDSQGFFKEGGAVLMSSSPLLPDHTPCSAPPTAPPLPPPSVSPAERKRRVRGFNWKPIPEERVKQQDGPSLWSRSGGDTGFHVDVRAIEELFGPQDTAGGGIGRGRAPVKEIRQQITVLDSKRSLNLSIFLKHLRKSTECVVDDVLHGNTGVFSVDSLRELLKLLPEEHEVRSLQMFSGNPSDLAPPDAFIHRLIRLPRYELRLEALLLKEEFLPSCSALKHDMSVICSAVRELLTCEELHGVLHLVLQAGNIMNAGGSAGNAVGFTLSSLLSLVETKANKPGMTLLHFVALEAQKKDLLMFPDKLVHVQRAARVCVDSVRVECDSLSRRVHQLQQNIQTDEELLTQLQAFLKSAAEALEDLKNRSDELQREGDALIDFFCEDKHTLKLDECLRILQNFCSKFKKAVQENVERGMWEESRHKRVKELEEKRHSWAGHEGVGGAVELSSSSEADVEAALKREGLLELLHSPLLRMGSGRRSRQQKSVTSELSCGTETLTLPPIHSLSIADAGPPTADTHAHGDTDTGHSRSDGVPTSTTAQQPVHLQSAPAVTSDPSQDAHSQSTPSTEDDLQLNSRRQETRGGATRPALNNSKPPAGSRIRPAPRPPPSSSSSSSSIRVSTSESPSLRKVLPLRQQIQERPLPPALSSARKSLALRPPPQEKICRSALGALERPSPATSTTRFTRATVASVTRSAPADRPPLTRTAALRLAHARQRHTPPAGHQRKSSTAADNTRGSCDGTVKQVWR